MVVHDNFYAQVVALDEVVLNALNIELGVPQKEIFAHVALNDGYCVVQDSPMDNARKGNRPESAPVPFRRNRYALAPARWRRNTRQ